MSSNLNVEFPDRLNFVNKKGTALDKVRTALFFQSFSIRLHFLHCCYILGIMLDLTLIPFLAFKILWLVSFLTIFAIASSAIIASYYLSNRIKQLFCSEFKRLDCAKKYGN